MNRMWFVTGLVAVVASFAQPQGAEAVRVARRRPDLHLAPPRSLRLPM